MCTVIALTGEEKLSGQHETVTMPSLLKAVSKSRAKKLCWLQSCIFLLFMLIPFLPIQVCDGGGTAIGITASCCVHDRPLIPFQESILSTRAP